MIHMRPLMAIMAESARNAADMAKNVTREHSPGQGDLFPSSRIM